jgi:hypothetical protein
VDGRAGQLVAQGLRTILPGMPPAAFALYASAARASGYTADLGAQVPLVDQAGEFDQLSEVGLLDEDDLMDVVPAGG